MEYRKKYLSAAFCLYLLSVLWMTVFFGALSVRAAEADPEMTFVLVTDVSNTMSKNDTKGYSKDAISMFLDMLPVEKTRAGIITFGHGNSGNAYPYQAAFLPITPEHPNFVHTVSDPAALSDEKEQLKTQVRDIVWNGEQTVIDAALLAGTDMLTASGTGDNAGCVILLTDGDYKSRYITDVKHVDEDLKKAVDALNARGWYVYCIELDYANDPANKASSHAFLTEKITDLCNGETYEVEDASDVGTAFIEILNNLYGTGSMETGITNADGYLTREFGIGDLTSEANITVIGNEILGVELQREGEVKATVGSFSTDADETSYDKNSFTVELGKIYCNVKMILPEQGRWTLRVRGAKDSSVVTNVVSYTDLVMHTEITPADTTEAKPLGKGDSIHAKLSVSYQGNNISKDNLGKAKASLRLTNLTTGEELSRRALEWNDAASSFETDVPVAELGRAGKLSAVCELKFGDGEVREGKEVTIYTHNEPLVLTDGSRLSFEGNVRCSLEPVDISGRFRNPDNDKIYVKTVFPDETADISASLSEDGKQLTVSTGNRAGTFSGNLLLWDADMGEQGAIRIPLTVAVTNRPMEMKKIGKIDLLAEHVLEREVDLNEYYADEDQPEIAYCLEEGYDPQVAAVSLNGNILKITAAADGTTEVTVSATDDDGTPYKNTFTVVGATEASIRSRKIREFWEKTSALAILLAVLAFAVLLGILFVRANTKLRGTWKVVISAPGKKEYSYELNTATDVARKDRKHAVLRRVLDLEELPEDQPSVAVLLQYSEKLNYVKLAGVFREEGCRISTRSGVKLLVNGEEASSAKLGSRDEAMVLIPGADGETAVSVRITI